MTRVTGGSLPRIAVGTSTMVGRRYTRGAPPLVGMRIATPAVRAAPAAARLTACLAGGCDDGAAGAPARRPPRGRVGGGGGGAQGSKRPRRGKGGTGGGRARRFCEGREDGGARAAGQ